MSVLYAISRDICDVFAAADERGGELSPEDLDRLDGLYPAFDGKVDAYCRLIRELESVAAARKAEAQRLQQLAGTAEANVRRLKERLRESLEMLGQRNHETPLFKVWRQKSPPHATLAARVEELPERFKKVEVSADFRAALAEWKETGQNPEGFVVDVSEHLRIR